MVWGWFFKIRMFSIFRMHAAGDFTVVYHIWLSYTILFCGYELDSSTWWQACMLFRIVDNIHAALVCQTKNLHYTCYIGIIITKSTHFDYHLRVSEVRCWLKDWYWLHYWPWAIDACRDPWRWKRPWWIGKEGKSCSRKMERKPWHLEFSSDYCQASAYDGGRNGAGVHRGLLHSSKLRT